jgi:mannitol/fructose-specific phosphotransferase system IIA component (Ntr-type)
MICLARVPAGIGFGSARGELTRLFFLICCHDDRQHLRVLARLMRILDGDAVPRLCDAETREDMLQILVDRETRVLPRTA